MIDFADLLIKEYCFDRVFSSTGAEANEGAIKLARKYGKEKKGGAFEIITASRAFHGRTLTAMSATGKTQWSSFWTKTKGFIQGSF